MAKQTWTLKGRIMFEPQFPETREEYGEVVPLPNVRVKISAKESKLDPTWNEWDTVRVGKEGRFSFTKKKDKTPRYFRVRVMFKDADLKLYAPNDGLLAQLSEKATGLSVVSDLVEDALEAALSHTSRLTFDVDWFTVYQTQEKSKRKGPGVVDFGNLVFKKHGAHERSSRIARRHADIWWLAKRITALLDEMGCGFTEKRPPAIIHPFQNKLISDKIEASFANPKTDVIHLIENSRTDDFDAGTVAHEFMHLWAYQHSKGELGLAWQLLLHGSTHDGYQKKPWVAYHEALAEFASNLMYSHIYNRPAQIYNHVDEDTDTELDNRARPFSHAFLKKTGIRSLRELDHYEYGWITLLTALVSNKLERLDPKVGEVWMDSRGSGTWTAGQLISRNDVPGLADILSAMKAHPKKGYPDVLSKDEMERVAFLKRLKAISDRVSDERVTLINELLDTGPKRGGELPNKPPRGPKLRKQKRKKAPKRRSKRPRQKSTARKWP